MQERPLAGFIRKCFPYPMGPESRVAPESKTVLSGDRKATQDKYRVSQGLEVI
jgi:hypothetical protein